MIADSAIRPISTTNTLDACPEYWRKAGTRRMAYIGIRNNRQAITGPPRVSIMPRMLGLNVATAQQLRIMNTAVARFSQLADITVVVRMDMHNRAPFDYYLFPRIDVTSERLRLAEDNDLHLDAYRFDTLDFFYDISAPVAIPEAA